MIDSTVAIDKMEKIGLEAVNAELIERGIDAEAVARLRPILELEGDNMTKLSKLEEVIGASETGRKGIEEMRTIFGYVEALNEQCSIELDLSLARGLNYYTGAIFEVKAVDYAIGSICGGGRYDDLTGIFGLPNVSGVGISFGADRIYDVMCNVGEFPLYTSTSTSVLFLSLGEQEQLAAVRAADVLRREGVRTEVYPDICKMKKQMEYANRRGIPTVVIIGSEELAEGKATIKRMDSGTQTKVDIDDLVKYVKYAYDVLMEE
jgi:histidyl-tRNA synthetase